MVHPFVAVTHPSTDCAQCCDRENATARVPLALFRESLIIECFLFLLDRGFCTLYLELHFSAHIKIEHIKRSSWPLKIQISKEIFLVIFWR
jgi:hypothetical protein